MDGSRIHCQGKAPVPIIPGFVSADYASIARSCSEIYSIIDSTTRKERVMRRIEAICAAIETPVSLKGEVVLFKSSQINPELRDFIKRNLEE